jgi:hypothetical protein
MKTTRYWSWIILIYVLGVFVRLFFAFQTHGFYGDESYFSLRQINNILHTGKPLYIDPLSLDHLHQFSPVFYYILALFGLFFPLDIVGKIIPNIFANLVVIGIYLLTLELTKNQKVSMIIAVTSTFIPIYFINTFNSITVYSLAIPLTVFALHNFILVSKGKAYINYFLVLIFLLAFMHPIAIILIIGLIIYLIIIKIEKLKAELKEIELIVFSLFLALWAELIIYKKAFLNYGYKVIFQNIPQQILIDYFKYVSLLDIINKIGILPLFFGIYIAYKFFFKENKRDIYAVISIEFLILLLLGLKSIPLNVGLMFLGVLLMVSFGMYLKVLTIWLKKTKLSRFEDMVLVIIIILFIFTSMLSTFY